MLEDLLVNNLWITLLLWVIIYISDYYCTLFSAHLYHKAARDHIVFSGSFELTPQFQSEIDNLRKFSPLFLRYVALSVLLIALAWFLMVDLLHVTPFFSLLIGGLFLRQVVIHMRHIRNLFLFSAAKTPGNLKGKLEYARPIILRQSAVELLGFSLLFLLIFGLTGSAFVLGGALASSVTGLNHHRLSAKAAADAGKPSDNARLKSDSKI